MNVADTINRYFAEDIARVFGRVSAPVLERAEEIRLRVDRPVSFISGGAEFFVTPGGELVKERSAAFRPGKEHIRKCVELMSGYSLYAFEEEIKRGYVTLPGGHRVGVTGKAVVENGGVKTIRHISGLNMRVSHEIKGCAGAVMTHIAAGGVRHTMIISPPGCGKTTLLRDITRQLSDGVEGLVSGRPVGVVDERSEIAGCYMGIPQNDVGIRTDVLDGCPKKEGMLMLLRSMSPRVIAVDEIGGEDDIHAIEEVINGGVAVICTVHGASAEDIARRPAMAALLDKRIFERFIVLGGPGSIKEIRNGEGRRLL